MKPALLNLSSLSISRSVSIASSAVLSVVAARALGPESYGQYALVFALIAYFAVFTDFGMSSTLVRDIAAGKHDVPSTLLPTLLIRAVLNGLSLVAMLIIGELWKREMFAAILSGFGILLLESIYTGFDAMFRGTQKMVWLSITEIVFALCRVLFGVIVLLGGFGLLPFLMSITAAEIVKLSLVAGFFFKQFSIPSTRLLFVTVKSLLRESYSVAAWQIVSIIYIQMNVPVIAIMLGDSSAGHFKAAMNVVDIPSGFITIFVTVIFPILADLQSRNPLRYKQVLESLLVIAPVLFFPALYFVQTIGAECLVMLFGEKFALAGNLLPIVFLLVWSNFFLSILGLVFLIHRRQHAAFLITVVDICVKAGLIVAGAHFFQSIQAFSWFVIGADAWSIALCVVVLVRTGFIDLRQFKIPLNVTFVGILCAGSILVLNLWLHQAWPVSLPVSIGLFALSLSAFRLVNVNTFRERLHVILGN